METTSRFLWQVIAERSPHHIVDGLRINRECSRHVVVAGPRTLREVRILHAPLNAAFRSVIELMPETNGALNNVAGISCAGSTCAGCVLVGWVHFGAAAAVVSKRRTITPNSTRRSGHRGRRGYRSSKRWSGQGVGRQLYGRIAFVCCAGAILITYVGVEVQFRVRMKFQSRHPVSRANGCQSSEWPRSNVGNLRRSKAPDFVARYNFQTNV